MSRVLLSINSENVLALSREATPEKPLRNQARDGAGSIPAGTTNNFAYECGNAR